MSRFYDALQRVSQERQEVLDLGSEPRWLHDVRSTTEAPASTRTEEVPTTSARTSPDDELTFTACTQRVWHPDTDALLFCNGHATGHAAEEFRALRSRLRQLRENQPLKTVLITSALAQEGKSFVAANLAHAFALQTGCRVLLVDANLRKPGLHSLFGTSPAPGLAEYLLDEKNELEIMQRGERENLFFVPTGRVVPGPTELLANGRLELLLAKVEPLFDWIIIDSPPSTPVSDVCSLAESCDGVLMVVRSHSTSFDVVR